MSATAQNSVTVKHDSFLPSASNGPLNSSPKGSEVVPPPMGGIAGAKAKLNKLDITRRDILKFEVVNGEVLISTKAGCKVLVRGRDIDKKTEENDVVVFSDGEVVSTDELIRELPPPQPSPSAQDLKEFNVCRALKESSSSSLVIPSPVASPVGLSAVGKVGIVAGSVGAVAFAESERRSNDTSNPSFTALQSIRQFAKDNTQSQPNPVGTFSYVGTPPTKATYETAGVTGISDKDIAAINDALATLAVTDESINTLAKLQALVNVVSAIIASTGGQLNAGENLTANSLLMLGLTSVNETNLSGIRTSISAQSDETNVNTVGELQSLIDFYNATSPTVALKVNNSTAITNDASLTVSDPASGATLLYSVNGGAFSSTYTPPTSQGQHTVSVRQISREGYLGQITALPFTYDTIAPTIIDLSAIVAGVQSAATVYVSQGGIQPPLPARGGLPSFLLPNITASSDTDIAIITFTSKGAIDPLDTLITQNNGFVKPFDTRSTPIVFNQTIAGVNGVSWRYDSTNKLFAFSKSDGSNFSVSEVLAIEKGLKFLTVAPLEADRTFHLSHTDAAGNVSQPAVITVKIDNVKPTIDLIAATPNFKEDAQFSYFNATHANIGKIVAPDMAAASDNDISAISMVMGGSGADPAHDTLVIGNRSLALDASTANGENQTIGSVSGISWSYVGKTLTFSKTDSTEMVATDVQSIEKALRFQISSGAGEGDRSFTFTHIDHAGNRSDGATVTFTVDTLAPSATLTTNANGIAAKSTEVGTAYLVKDSLAVTQLNDILAAADDLWNATSINAVNIDTSLDTRNLSNGSYVLYTSDRAGNLSTSTSNHVVL
jgi:hypothetical protein